MSGLADPPSRNTVVSGATDAPGRTRKLPLLSSSVPSSGQPMGDPMEVTPPASAAATGAGPSVHNNSDNDRAGGNTIATSNGSTEPGHVHNHAAPSQAIGAAAAAQQPKVVQTAFIHKLYNDVFHTGSPDSALWEFKHGNGNFKRGDLIGLREIKRRASRHALIHRDSFPGHKAAASQPGTPAEPVPDATEARLMNLEHTLYDMHNRLGRAEEGNAALNARCLAMAESLSRCYHWTHSISRFLQGMIPDREGLLYRDVSSMQAELEKHLDSVRALEHPPDPYLSIRQPYVPTVSVDPGPPLSPRQMPQEDSRRPSVMDTTRPNMIRPPVPSHLAVSPRRYGSIGAANSSPTYGRPQVPTVIPPQQPMPHPLSSVSSPPGPNLARRHTSADIRQHGWPPPGVSPFQSAHQTGTATAPWSPSPHRTPNSSDQQVREVLAQYEMGAPRRLQDTSRHATPPLNPDQTTPGPTTDNGWTLGPRFPRHDTSLPATRRSSMASNVHSLLNPADTAERPDEDQHATIEDRKRKRLE